MLSGNHLLKVFIFVPGLSDKYRSGGLLVIQDIADLLKEKDFSIQFVATEEKHSNAISPEEAFKSVTLRQAQGDTIFITTWGPLVEKHIKLIRKKVPDAKIIYYAQSFGWGIKIPKDVPIVCVSKFVMSQWQKGSPQNLITHIPPPLNPYFCLQDRPRDIDILVHTRKQNDYCLKKLVPKLLTTNYKLQTINQWIPQEQFAELLSRTKVFLYATSWHRAGLFRKLPAEGFGLPALEAAVSGAKVASNLLGGVTDFLIPGENCIVLEEDLGKDLEKIQKAVQNFSIDAKSANTLKNHYSREVVKNNWKNLLKRL